MVWSPQFRESIEDRFRLYCQTTHVDVDKFGNTLETFIGSWLYGDYIMVVKLTGGDYSAWLEAVIIIVDAHAKDPSIIYYDGEDNRWPKPREHKVDRIFDLKEWGDAFLDRHVYQKFAAWSA
jgi:hypothetical protein